MAEDNLGQKWVGTKGGGCFIVSPDGKRIVAHYSLVEDGDSNRSGNDVFSLLCDSEGRMWMTTFGGGLKLASLDDQGRPSFRSFTFGDTELNRMRSIVQDREGIIWVGTDKGIVIFRPEELMEDPHSFDVIHIRADDGRTYDEAKVIYADSKGQIWVGATGGGLCLLERSDPINRSVFQHFGINEGLINSTVQAIEEDYWGNIWVSTESGISRYNIDQGRFENFLSSNNQRTTVFNEMASWQTSEGVLMFGSYDGLYIFDPQEVHLSTYNPPVIITTLWINGNVATAGADDSPLTESIVNTRSLTLSHDQNSLNLECTMMNYRAPEFNQYAYYLDGYEDDWNPSSLSHTATYRNLPPGRYTFKVTGCNSYGVRNEGYTSLSITILPPWWRSWWAYTLYIVAALLLAGIAIRVLARIQRLRMAVTIEQQMTEYKLRFFTNLSHEFRTPLTIIRGVIEELASHSDLGIGRQVSLLSKSSNRLMRLIDQLLEFRKVQGGKGQLRLELTAAERFLHDIFLSFQDMARQKAMKYRFESNLGGMQLWIDRSKVDKMAYNLLSNAFRYTPDGGTIAMRLKAADDNLVISVADSGPGIPIEQRDKLFKRFEQVHYTASSTGIGLNLTAELANLHHGRVNYSTSDLGGACFTIRLPLSGQVYDDAEKLRGNNVSPDTPPTVVATDLLSTETEADELLQTAKVDRPYKDYRLLMVDDDPDVRTLIEMQLGQLFTLNTAKNGVEALEMMRQEQPDLVICDIMMPQMDGIAFTRRVRADHNICHIPIILLTAYSSEGEQLKGIQAGADSYITKPFSLKYLTARVVGLIEQRERLHHRFASEPGETRPLISTTDWDKVLLDKVQAMVEQNMGDADFKLEAHISDLGLGRTTFFNKLKALTGCTPGEYVRVQRLKRAAHLLVTTQLNISEVGYQVGIDDPYYFSKCFKTQFGRSPTQYRKDPAGSMPTNGG